MPRLIYIMKESGDPSLRLSALWAVKNVLRKTSTETKRDVMSHLGWSHLVEYVFILSSFDTFVYVYATFFRLLSDPDEDVQEQAFNVVRNLTESEEGIAMVFKEVGREVLSCVTAGLSSGNDNVVLQVFYIFLFYYFYLFKKSLTTCTLGSLCARQHVERNIRTTRYDPLLPQPPIRSPSLSFRSQSRSSRPCSILHP